MTSKINPRKVGSHQPWTSIIPSKTFLHSSGKQPDASCSYLEQITRLPAGRDKVKYKIPLSPCNIMIGSPSLRMV